MTTKNLTLQLFTLTFALILTSCNDDNGGNNNIEEQYDFTEILNDYVDSTVIVTYANMKNSAIELFDHVEDFKASNDQNDLNAACQSWRDTRTHWEQSEAFLFGPAAYQSLDPLLDSWPLDQDQLDQVLSGSQELTADYIRNGLGAVLRGFHTIEYLLFRNGEPRSVGDVTTREEEYLVAVTQVLRDDCILLWALWHGSNGVSSVEAEVLEDLEINAGEGYRVEFKKAGQAGSRYVSQNNAIDEIIQGTMDIADEVGNGKLADPFTTKNPLHVESWFSWNSLSDFKNNIRSIENAFYGGSNKLGTGLITFIAEKDETVASVLQTKINDAIEAIDGIPEPFRNNLDKTDEVQAAIDAVNDLTDFITDEIYSLIN